MNHTILYRRRSMIFIDQHDSESNGYVVQTLNVERGGMKIVADHSSSE